MGTLRCSLRKANQPGQDSQFWGIELQTVWVILLRSTDPQDALLVLVEISH